MTGSLPVPYSADSFGGTCTKTLVVPDAGVCNAVFDASAASGIDGGANIDGLSSYDGGAHLDSARDSPIGN